MWKESFYLVQVYQLLGKVYKRQGSVCESKYFYKRGLDFTKRLHLHAFQFEFELNLTDLNSCCVFAEEVTDKDKDKDLDVDVLIDSLNTCKLYSQKDSKESLNSLNSLNSLEFHKTQNANQYNPQIPPTLSCHHYFILGDQQKRSKQMLESKKNYEKAQETLDSFMNKDYIDLLSLNRVIDPLESKDSKDSKKSTKNSTKTIKTVKKKTLNYSCFPLEELNVSANLKKCFLFQEFHHYKECKSILKQIQTKSMSKIQETQLYELLAKLNKRQLFDGLNGNMWFEMYKESGRIYVTILFTFLF